MSDYQPIDCRYHDYLEIACLHSYRLRIRTRDGRIFAGTATTTRTTAKKAEFLELDVGGATELLRLDQIVQIEPLTPGASFGAVRFDER